MDSAFARRGDTRRPSLHAIAGTRKTLVDGGFLQVVDDFSET